MWQGVAGTPRKWSEDNTRLQNSGQRMGSKIRAVGSWNVSWKPRKGAVYEGKTGWRSEKKGVATMVLHEEGRGLRFSYNKWMSEQSFQLLSWIQIGRILKEKYSGDVLGKCHRNNKTFTIQCMVLSQGIVPLHEENCSWPVCEGEVKGVGQKLFPHTT